MVRLKVVVVVIEAAHLHISIPYGSIKREREKLWQIQLDKFQFLMVRLKAELEKEIHRTKYKFQFLMVRLKDPWPQQVCLF